MKITLSASLPFRFHSVVHSHGWYQLAPFAWDAENGVLSKVERLASGRVVVMQMRHADNGVSVEVRGRLTKAEAREVTDKTAWMFMLEADFGEFYALADQEPRLAHVRPQAHGRFLRSTTIYEDLTKVIMTTNIQWSGTKRLAQALVNRFGDQLDADPLRRAFPQPEAVARSRESTLRGLGFGYRAPYILQLSRGVAAGKLDLRPLTDQQRTTEEVRKDLLALPGIGPYAAGTMLGILGRYDFIGVDSQAMSAVSKWFYAGKPVGPKEIEAVFGRWGKFRALAYWFWDWEGQQQAPMEAYEAQRKQD